MASAIKQQRGRPPKKLFDTSAQQPLAKSDTAPQVKAQKPSDRINTLRTAYEWVDARKYFIPLVLAISVQSFTVGVWIYKEFALLFPDGFMSLIIILVAIAAGLSLESVMIGSVLSQSNNNWIKYATLVIAWLGSTWIALALFNTGEFIVDGNLAWDLKHAIWPTIICVYLLDMASHEKA